ncbi:MAG TPA: type ISP restriction/modification enzyme, partial [Nitrolancea sp.]
MTRPRDVAWFLASYAREARGRPEAADLDELRGIRQALEESLGITFTGERGDHFFRSTLVQTLFYGVFSAWVLWSKRHPSEKAEFDWREAGWFSNVPVIAALFEQISTPRLMRDLDLVEVLDWAGMALNRVDRAAFFAVFEEGNEAVQYFYEPFLEAFDPELRKELGVWYTPNEVVRYMVSRVDAVLREDLGIANGLADERVVVLDPACGTGSYLVEVLRQIAARLQRRGDALWAHDLKRAATERIIGFEIMPAPFVVSHLQIGLLLENLGAPLTAADRHDDGHERAAVYLTNSLTGWGEHEPHRQSAFLPEMDAERDAADHVKRETPVLVILGNPPYNGYPGIAMAEERGLVEGYRQSRHTRQPQGQGLNDLYVRFFRMAERQIVEQTGKGIVCFISNYSWLDGLSHPAMRERYRDVFDQIWIDNLNGDSRETGKVTPWGDPDPSVFSTERNREGIQVGTAIALPVRDEQHIPAHSVRYRDLWGRTKLAELKSSAKQENADLYQEITPKPELGLPFAPMRSGSDYLTWPLLPELFPTSFPGVKTSRDDALVDIDRADLIERMQSYFDPTVSNEAMRHIAPSLMEKTNGFDPVSTRTFLLQRGFRPENIVRYLYRPFDARWLYWEAATKLLDRNRAEYFPHVMPGNLWLALAQRYRRAFDSPLATTLLSSLHVIERGTN